MLIHTRTKSEKPRTEAAKGLYSVLRGAISPGHRIDVIKNFLM